MPKCKALTGSAVKGLVGRPSENEFCRRVASIRVWHHWLYVCMHRTPTAASLNHTENATFSMSDTWNSLVAIFTNLGLYLINCAVNCAEECTVDVRWMRKRSEYKLLPRITKRPPKSLGAFLVLDGMYEHRAIREATIQLSEINERKSEFLQCQKVKNSGSQKIKINCFFPQNLNFPTCLPPTNFTKIRPQLFSSNILLANRSKNQQNETDATYGRLAVTL